jgi:hypothetical protein
MSGFYCKGSLALGNGCGKCERCAAELVEMRNRARDVNAIAWRYRILGIRDRRFAYEDDASRLNDMLAHDSYWVEPLFDKIQITQSKPEYEAALIKIAFDPDVSDLAGNPSLWASIIAFLALGGRIAGGKKIDTKDDVLNRLTNN